VGGNDRPGLWRHLAYFAGQAIEGTLAVSTGGSSQNARYSTGAGEERGEREAREAEVGAGKADSCKQLALVEFFGLR
jgi:hypothetical protein